MGDEKITATMSMKDVVANDDNIFTFAAAKAGSKCFGTDGTKYIFTREALEVNAASFVDGKTTLNHSKDDGGKILASWFDVETDLLMMNVQIANDETAARMTAGESTGVSIEANLTDWDNDKNILEYDGTGISVIFYPEKPACPLEDGCGIVASDNDDDISMSTEPLIGGNLIMATDIETIPKTDYDEVVAKLTEAQSEIDVLKTDETVKAKDVEIAAKDVVIEELTAEIDRRDTEIAASMVEEIKAWDAEFSPADIELSTIKTIHASLARAMVTPETEPVVASEPEEEVVANDFTAPEAAQKSNGLTVGGIVNGVWKDGTK